MVDTAKIVEFIEDYWGEKTAPAEGECVFEKLGIDGDDAFEFMEKYSEAFSVNLDDYRWYFHNGEEGWGLGAILFKPPYRRVCHIPITIETLANSASLGKWTTNYPEHELPKHRYDVLFNQLFVLFLLLLVFALLIMKWF